MQKQDISDDNYTNGCIYQKLIYLQPGTYNYSFECYDWKFYNSTITHIGLNVIETNKVAPYLMNPNVSPTIGGNSTLFNFTVLYFDPDNNFPEKINITLDGNIFPMLPVNPLDDNAMNGRLYFYNTTILTHGFYSFQINCYDGNFSDATNWIDGPEVNPFYSVSSDKIVLNEICANPDFIEINNYGANKDMTGWYIEIYDNNYLDDVYYFPDAWIFKGNNMVVLHEYSGTDTDTDLYTGFNIYWTSSPIAVGLFNDKGENVDWFQTSTHALARPGDAEWENDASLIISNNHAYRNTDVDTNKASDWTVSYYGSQGALNPSQTGQGYIWYIISPSDSATLLNTLNTFQWNSINFNFSPVNFTFQISNGSDFSHIIYENYPIIETMSTTSIKVDLNYPVGKYYWRVRPTSGPYIGIWTTIFSFNLIRNRFAPVLKNATCDPLKGYINFTVFNFSVVYSDADNNAPLYVNLTIYDINNTINITSMHKQNPYDNNYIDGCNYTISCIFSNITVNCSFIIDTHDGINGASSGKCDGPVVTIKGESQDDDDDTNDPFLALLTVLLLIISSSIVVGLSILSIVVFKRKRESGQKKTEVKWSNVPPPSQKKARKLKEYEPPPMLSGKQEGDLEIGVKCSACGSNSYIPVKEMKFYCCNSCSATNLRVVYECSKCKEYFSISRFEYVDLQQPDTSFCAKCGIMGHLVIKPSESHKTMKEPQVQTDIAEQQRKHIKILPPVVSAKKRMIGIICTQCTGMALIPEEIIENHICENCSNKLFKILYYCQKCIKNYSIAYKDYMTFKEPATLDCPVCNESIQLIEREE